MDRNHPLEKIKAENMEVTNKIMPKWMEIKNKNVKGNETFKFVEFIPMKQKAKQLIVLVDKDLNPSKIKNLDYSPERSVFNYGDFRNNVFSQKEKELYDSKVSQRPRQFYNWDDGKKYIPKYSKDI